MAAPYVGFVPRIEFHVDAVDDVVHHYSKLPVSSPLGQVLERARSFPSSPRPPRAQRFFFVSPIHSRIALALP